MKLDLSGLNDHQRQAVLHTTGPLLVLAGAGSGKTSTMAYRIAHLITVRKISPAHILGLSFTRKAAAELKERVQKLSQSKERIQISTFHSLCVQILRGYCEKLGYNRGFSIIDQNDSRDLIKQILRQIKLDDRKFDPDFLGFEIGQAKNRFLEGDAAEAYFAESGRMSGDYADVAPTVYVKYQEQLKLRNAFDFDDLLFQTVKLLNLHDPIRELLSKKYQQILVDEYQDTNPAQFNLLELLTSTHDNLCVVGDDDQSIYGWRGADSAHILGFSRHFKNARIITLDQNYRSTTTILDAANQVIQKNSKRHPKTLWSARGLGEPIQEYILEHDRDEAEFVAAELLTRQKAGRRWGDFAILYRSNPQSRVFEEALRVNQIPYKLVGALSFLDRKEIKDALSYFKLILNPLDEASIRRVINWPARGVGKSAIEKIHTHAVEQGTSFGAAMKLVQGDVGRGSDGVLAFVDLLKKLSDQLEAAAPTAQGTAEWAQQALQQIGVKKALFDDYAEDPAQAQKRWDIVDELTHGIGQMTLSEIPSPVTAQGILREYLTRMMLGEVEDEKDKKEEDAKKKDQVTLLTLHGAKGLEFPVVFLVGMEDGLLPHQRTIDEAQDLSEERRLCYVGITRARDHLLLTRAKTRIRYGKALPRNPSRFLAEIPAELRIVSDQSHSPDLSTEAAKEAHEVKVKGFLESIRAQLERG